MVLNDRRILMALGAVGIPLVVLAALALTCFAVVGAGQVGVKDTFGNVDATVFGPGFYVKNPLMSVVPMSTQTQNIDMSGGSDLTSLTVEGVTIQMDATVLYHIDPDKAPEIYKTIGADYADVILIPEIRGATRSEIAKYKAEDIYSQERVQIAQNITDDLNAKFAANERTNGIHVDDFILRKVVLPDQLTQAIQAKQAAEQQIQQKQYQVDVEKAEAQRKVVEAQGIADANKIIDGSLSDNYLRWYAIEQLAGNKNVTIFGGSGFDVAKVI